MKVSKIFCIDVGIAEKLKQIDNSSSLVNGLLLDYFRSYEQKGDEIEQKQALLRDFKKKSKQIRKEMLIFKSINALKFDNFCCKWCILHIDYSESERIDLMINYIKSRRLRLSLEDFKKGYELIKNNVNLFKKT
jgi:hypothetical protein